MIKKLKLLEKFKLNELISLKLLFFINKFWFSVKKL